MPHIHTEPGQHDLTVSAFILNRDRKLLLHKHKKFNRYMQHGGHVELHEDPWTAVLREIKEETGYIPEDLNLYVPPMGIIPRSLREPNVFHPYPIAINTHQIGDNGHWHTDISYAFRTFVGANLNNISYDESIDFIWIDSDELITRRLDIPSNVRSIMEYVMMDVARNWGIIPIPKLHNN